MQPEKASEVRGWLEKAQLDLRCADADLAAVPPIVEDALFHCQQAAEKAMKAFLVAQDIPFKKTHDLDEIASACEAKDAALFPILDPARELSVFAWTFRYPGDMAAPSLAEARSRLAVARSVHEAILSRLPAETHPKPPPKPAGK